MGLLFIPILFIIMYVMMIRPQQQRAKQQALMLSQLDIGDDVVTAAGVYGRVSDIDGDTLFLLISDGVEIKITKESVAALVTYGDVDDDLDDDLDDDE